MSKLIDLSGNKYGRLSVQSFAGRLNHRTAWNCLCDCGKSIVARGNSLATGNTLSCGCLKLEGAGRTTHGHTKHRRTTPEYRTWRSMIDRCENPRNVVFRQYGAKGISVCKKWRESFSAFLSDMGLRPNGASIDRIDTFGNYEPGNCRWANQEIQHANMRSNRVLTFKGESLCLFQWAKKLGLAVYLLNDRLNKLGWSVERAFSTPPRRLVRK